MERLLRLLRPQNLTRGTLCFPPAPRCPPDRTRRNCSSPPWNVLSLRHASLPSPPIQVQLLPALPQMPPDPAQPSRKQAALSGASRSPFSLSGTPVKTTSRTPLLVHVRSHPPRVSVPSGQERGLLPFSPAPTELQGVSPRCLTNTHMGGVTDLTRSMVNGVCHRMYVYSSSRVLGRCLRLGRTSSRQAHSAQA